MNRINKSVGWGWAVSAVLFLATSAQAQMFRGVGVKPAGETKATSNEVRVEQEGQGTNAPAESPKTKTTRPDREKGRAVPGRRWAIEDGCGEARGALQKSGGAALETNGFFPDKKVPSSGPRLPAQGTKKGGRSPRGTFDGRWPPGAHPG
jgi:hypothetical protein